MVIQYILKKVTRGNIRSADKLSSNIEIENANISNQLILRLLKVVKIIVYNINIIKSEY